VTPAAVEIVGVSKDYRGLRPLRIERLELAAGTRVALVGLDEPAAEVLVNLVTGAVLPDTGAVRLFGRETSGIADSADWLATVDRFGIVSTRAVLLDALSVTQNLAVPFTLDIEPPPEAIRARAQALACEAGLPPASWDRAVGALDDEGRMRVRLARAIALDPSVLLLEHASAGVARSRVAGFAADIRRIAIRRCAAVLAATGDIAFAEALAGRVLTHEPATGRLKERRPWFGHFGRR
jgi:ABC-type transporter Mla maintaining outer membrane lipid asymmetry ATPase subunit MlaF